MARQAAGDTLDSKIIDPKVDEGVLGTRKIVKGKEVKITIKPPNLQVIPLKIVGNAPLVMNKWTQKAKEQMHNTQAAGSTAKKNKKREPKDFEAIYEQCRYTDGKGTFGIPATAFKEALVRACSLVAYAMTSAKLALFVEADLYDSEEGRPLVKITKGKPHYHESICNNDNGKPDLRVRACWDPGWEAIVRVRFDADQFTATEVVNLMMRVGLQVGVLEGRPFSKNSCGQGWGTFDVKVGAVDVSKSN